MLIKHFSQFLTESLEKEYGTQMGSNDGGIHVDTKTGQKHYLKFPADNEQAHVEVATAKLYDSIGLPTLGPQTHQNGPRTGVISKFNDHLVPSSKSSLIADLANPAHASRIALAHHAAVITNNRDILGMEFDNLLKHRKTGELISADQGAAMHYRAMGEQKEFDHNIKPLIDGFQNSMYPAGQVFSKVPKDAMKAAAEHIKQHMTDDKIDAALGEHDLAHHSATVKSRRDSLLTHYGVK